ncbi:Peroxidase 40 [Dendrobium catenatum]|uniref:Peroxidase n=2 Tax=Dendrobium catenatum TaxID=906689 RepID=A0A2I0XDL6_9ASPA|nr:Peroxidase 40 [Dendrobium catenatum]
MMNTNLASILFCVILITTTAFALTKECLDPNPSFNSGSGSLQFNTYETSCPLVEPIIFAGVERAVSVAPRMAASLLRLHFHDCFVNGCDASILLDDTATFIGEKTAAPNLNSLRGFDVIDNIKAELETVCPGIVSCADILAVAARDSVLLLGGPSWQVEMGRKDSFSANKTEAENTLPGPNSNVATLTQKFQNVGISQRDMVILSGAHTIGKARCATFSSRFSFSGPGSSVLGDQEFIVSLQQLCSSGSNNTQVDLDLVTPSTFDNQYYVNLLSGDGLLPSDQALLGPDAGVVEALVGSYAADVDAFFEDFKAAMVRMGRLVSPAGNGGEVRRCCRVVNS